MGKSLNLNPEQKKAIEHDQGPLIVVAGAGTGKTRVITERVRYLIQEKGVDPDAILALTFTDKAAGEMLQRIGDVMPLGYKEPWVATFHSFADRILRREGLEIGLDISYQILTYPKQWLLVRKNLFDFDLDYYRPLGNPSKFISAMLKFVSRLQDEAIDDKEFAIFADGYMGEADEKRRWRELSNFYTKYQELKLKKSYVDFGDLILWCLKLFISRPTVLKKYQQQFKHIMVDEFQDTNFAQYELIKKLFPLREVVGRSLLVVGDDSQSIYKFRGAAISNILEFQRDYKKSGMVTLIKNYRSCQQILDPAYNLIQNNNPDTLECKLNISKQLIAEKEKSRTEPQVVEFSTLEEEVSFVVGKIRQLLEADPGISYGDIAILARANNHLDPFVVALRSADIPYQVVGNRGLYDREEVKDVMAILRVLANTMDGISLFRALSNPVFDIPQVELSRLLSEARFKKLDLWDCLQLSKNERVRAFIARIHALSKGMLKFTPSNFVYNLVSDVGILSLYAKQETTENLLALRNLNLFLDQIKSFERDYYRDYQTTPTILDFLEYLDLMIEAGDNPAQAEIEDIDTVSLSTVHAAKGLEYQAVFMVNLVSGRFPSREREDLIEIPSDVIKETLPAGDEHLQEERRLFYVAMTRAKRYLFLTYAKNYGGKRDAIRSGFLEETGILVTGQNKVGLLPNGQRGQLSMFGSDSAYRKISRCVKSFNLDYVNYTQISTYQTCPFKYKFAYVLNVPGQPSYVLAFGNTIHNTLRDFHRENRLGHKQVTFERFLELYKKHWDDTGYIDARHRKNRFDSGVEILRSYYDKEKDLDKNILELEKTVHLKLAGVEFSGRVDRIDRLGGKRVEIIDYKTGKLKEQKEVDKDLQTSLYAWAVRESLGFEPEVLSLYFIEDLQKVSSRKSLDQIKEQVTEAEGVVETMKSGSFPPTPGKHCEWCDYNGLCPYAQKNS